MQVKVGCKRSFALAVVLTLIICGSHSAATHSLTRIDDGLPQSVTGEVVGSVALVVITSGRDGSVFTAKAEHSGRLLKWQLLELQSGDGKDYVLAEAAVPRKVDASEALGRVSRECS